MSQQSLLGDGMAGGSGLEYRVETHNGKNTEGVFSFSTLLMRQSRLLPGVRVVVNCDERGGTIRRVVRGGYKIRQRTKRAMGTVNVGAHGFGGTVPLLSDVRLYDVSEGLIKFSAGPIAAAKPQRPPIVAKPDAPRPYAKVRLLTPKLAIEYLERAVGVGHRRAGQTHVDNMALSILVDQFPLNGATLKFDIHGNLRDGQQRCLSVIKAGKSIETFVVYDLDPDVFMFIDVESKPRRLKDLITMARPEATHVSVQASITHTELAWQERTPLGWPQGGTQGHTHSKTLFDTFKFWELGADDFQEAAAIGGRINNRSQSLVVGSILGFFYYKARHYDPDAAHNFLLCLAEGHGLAKGDPILVARNRFLRAKSESVRIPRNLSLGLLIKAWTYHLAGESVRTITLPKPSRQFPDFPKA